MENQPTLQRGINLLPSGLINIFGLLCQVVFVVIVL